MSKKFTDIDAVVRQVEESSRAIPLDDPNVDVAFLKLQRNAAPVTGAMVRFFMEEVNNGSDPMLVAQTLATISANAIYNVVSTAKDPVTGENAVHAAIHALLNTFDHVLHQQLALDAGEAPDGIGHHASIDLELHEVQ